MRCKMAVVVPGSIVSDADVNLYLDDFLAPYYFDNEDAYECIDDVTDDAKGEWRCYLALRAQGRLPDVSCATWQDYARQELGWQIGHEADGDHAYAPVNPNGLMDYHYDWHGEFPKDVTFGDTGRDRIGLDEMASLVRTGSYGFEDVESLILGDGDFVGDDSGAMADEVRCLSEGDALPGYDLIVGTYHV